MKTPTAKKHIAQSGKKAGQWVPCYAENCRIGGQHISNEDLRAAQLYQKEKTGEKVNLSSVPLEAVVSFMASPEREKDALRGAIKEQDEERAQARADKAERDRRMEANLERAARELPEAAKQRAEQVHRYNRGLAAVKVVSFLTSETPMDYSKESATFLGTEAANLGLSGEDRKTFFYGAAVIKKLMAAGPPEPAGAHHVAPVIAAEKLALITRFASVAMASRVLTGKQAGNKASAEKIVTDFTNEVLKQGRAVKERQDEARQKEERKEQARQAKAARREQSLTQRIANFFKAA